MQRKLMLACLTLVSASCHDVSLSKVEQPAPPRAATPPPVTVTQTPPKIDAAPPGVRTVPNRWFVQFRSPPVLLGGTREALDAERDEFAAQAKRADVKPEKKRDFTNVWNGQVLALSPSQLRQLNQFTMVAAVFPVVVVDAPEVQSAPTPDLASAVVMTGADIAQSTLGLSGAGVRVGVIDTGIDYQHPDLGGCFGPGCRVAFGYDFVGDDYSGVDGTEVPDADPDDCAGHGTHVAGIVGANGAVKGVAPGVTFGAYRVFGCTGSTSSDIMLAAMERASNDNVRIINMSIGSPFAWPEYPTAAATVALNAAGVVVTTSNGNSGTSGMFAGGAPGSGAGAIATGSVENTMLTQLAFLLSGDGKKVGYVNATGAPLAPLSGSFPLVRTGTPSVADDACNALPAGSLTGNIALVRRGTCSFFIKANNVQAAGAAGMVLYNNVAGALNPTVVGGPTITIPVVAVVQADGQLIDARIAAGATTLTWSNQTAQTPQATAWNISDTSSPGPTAELDLKPDLSAPGGSIYSTFPVELGSYASLSGTSMASPHIAGAAALLMQAQPTLSPDEIRVQLSNSARPMAWPGDASGNTPEPVFRQGAGLVQIDRSALMHTRISPQKLPLGENLGAAVTRTLTFTNASSTSVTFAASHLPAASITGNLRAANLTRSNSTPSTVVFGSSSITVLANGSATLDVTITPDASLANASFFSGYLVFTAGTDVLRVPYGGYKGDYQAQTVLTAAGNGYPTLASFQGSSWVKQPAGGTWTLQNGDVPNLAVHYEFFARQQRIEAFDAVNNKPWGEVSSGEFIGRDVAATAVNYYPWDGTVTLNKQQVLVPNGTYVLRLRVLKALGDENVPSDWETYLSPAINTRSRNT